MSQIVHYSIKFAEEWDSCFPKFDTSVQKRIMKKVLQLQSPVTHRHLRHGLPFFVLELVRQYRICFIIDEKSRTKELYFVGDHKQYERWLARYR